MGQPLLEVNNVKKYYSTSSSGFLRRLWTEPSEIRAVDNCSLRIDRGEIVGLVGESGSGKTTWGETICRLEEPTAGEIFFEGVDITSLNKKELKAIRNDIQIIFQDPFESLNPMKTIYQLLAEPVDNFESSFDRPKDEVIRDILYDVGLRPPESYLYSYPRELSGGQLQRVGIARALILEPELLIADEPMSMLDVSTQSGIVNLLHSLKETYDLTILYISHNLSLVQMLSDRIYVMYKGKVVEEGAADAIVSDPKHPYTQALIASIPNIDTDRERIDIPQSNEGDGANLTGCTFHPRCPERFDKCPKFEPALAEGEGRNVRCFLYHDETDQSDPIATEREGSRTST